MIRRGSRVVSGTGSRESRFGPNALTCVLARRTKARERQTGHSSHHSRVFRRMRKTLLSTLSLCNELYDGASLVLPPVVSIAFLLMADIDTPRTGFISLASRNLMSLSESMPMNLARSRDVHFCSDLGK